ncbi:MAG: ABC transporter ATP-binding protein [Cardiobacteriaceae bacterium]|nr:ABC transporter ATP-binding protein [Cardiobacteriaceae bacterium]
MYQTLESKTNPFPESSFTLPPKRLLPFIWHFCAGFRKPLAAIMILGILLAILEVLLFDFLGSIVDWLGQLDAKALWQTQSSTLMLMAAVTLIALPLLNALSTTIRHQMIMGNMPMAIRWKIHRYLLGQSMSFYQDEFAGRVSSKVMMTALAIRSVANTVMDVMVYVTVYFSSIVVLLGMLHWAMMVVMLFWFVGYVMLLRYFLPRLKQASEEQSDARALMTGRITDAYTNIATVKLFAHTNREAKYAKDSMQSFLGTVYGQMRLVSRLDIWLTNLNYLLIFSITALGLSLWQQSALTIGGLAIATSLALRLNGMSQWVLWELSGLFENIGTVADGMEMLTRPMKVQDKEDAKALCVTKGEIEFKNVSFAYHKHDDAKHVLNQLSLHIKAGEKIGLVGHSGAGKSTLVNALLRFYDIDSGEILIDGQNIAHVSQDSLRQHIAMVTQDTSLLHRSVRDNVLYGKPEADDEALHKALYQAEAFDFIEHLTDPRGRVGLEAQVGERGVKLSGGQRQRIAIARVLLKDAPILILDEATSALDSEVEAAIQASLTRLMEGKTVIAIAHRLSTIAAMDRLIVMENGKIAEQGSHEDLLAQGGIYARLWARQTGGYLGE